GRIQISYDANGHATLTCVLSSTTPPPPPTGTIFAIDFGFEGPTGDATVTIAAGGTVTFAYPNGGSFHNIVFSDAQPTSCTQTAGSNVGAVPPLRATPEPSGWAGSCRFNTPGTYTFTCAAHAFETGTVIVQGT